MEDYITVSAKTLDDAITEALVQLGVTSDRLDYIVVEKGSEGFLGIGRKQAVIKARRKREEKPVEETVEESKVETPVKEEVKPEKDIAKLADIFGHSSINTTRIYIVATGSEHRQRMENMRLII